MSRPDLHPFASSPASPSPHCFSHGGLFVLLKNTSHDPSAFASAAPFARKALAQDSGVACPCLFQDFSRDLKQIPDFTLQISRL